MYHVNRGPQADSEYSVEIDKVFGLSRLHSAFSQTNLLSHSYTKPT